MTFVPDESQLAVIQAKGGYHLVLAPPGCGKTQILTERIIQAHALGMDYEDMLCLTFTNRAARGMQERLNQLSEVGKMDSLYVGNVHRFCSKFLFANSLIPAESSIIDDDDAVSILARYRDDDEAKVMDSYQIRREYAQVIFFSHLMDQIHRQHPKTLRLHPECCTPEDVQALRIIAEKQHMEFNAAMMWDVYTHADLYRDMAKSDVYDMAEQRLVFNLLTKMEQALAFSRYKTENRLIDFEDLLIITYDALRNDTSGIFHRYKWIQIDEVQDLNPMQLAIVDMLTVQKDFTVVYLGDEQQAIFAFMGAKISTLEMLKERCQGQLHRLYTNHRSPSYLLNVFNSYAQDQLHIPAALLPKSGNNILPSGNELTLRQSLYIEQEATDVANHAAELYRRYAHQTTAIIVSSNADADMMSARLNDILLPHFKVSGVDLFATPEMKLLLAHFNVMVNESNFIGWSRLLHGMGVYRSAAAARQFMVELKQRAMLPSDFLIFPKQTTYLEQFVEAYNSKVIVVFDTETTGLNPLEDDIVQIAAVKIRNGVVDRQSHFNMFLHTDREIPKKLGDIDNPLIEEIKHHTQHEPSEALQAFLDYSEGCVLLAHNALFDYSILRENINRHLPEKNIETILPECYDSLKLARLLEPDLMEYKLKYLISVLQLEGENSHLADDDVNATVHLVNHCYQKAQRIIPEQQSFLSQPSVKNHVLRLQQNYATLYNYLRSHLDDVQQKDALPLLVEHLKLFYDELHAADHVKTIEKIDYVLRYLAEELVDSVSFPTLRMQLQAHMMEINTLKEADLCNAGNMRDRVFVSTVHKAKGLEFDNVIVFDAVDGRYPNYYSKNNPEQVQEDARKFYVAMSRAKLRLCIAYSTKMKNYYGKIYDREITPFMKNILKFFNA